MNTRIIPYNSELIKLARELRANPTPAEARLWTYLNMRQRRGFSFCRQKPLLYFIVDFFCGKVRLAIEVDGSVHDGREDEDYRRRKAISRYGVSFLRFTNDDVFHRIEHVLSTIDRWLDENATSPPQRRRAP